MKMFLLFYTMRHGSNRNIGLYQAENAEDVAKTLILAKQIGRVQSLPQEQIQLWNDRYQNRYGQSKAA